VPAKLPPPLPPPRLGQFSAPALRKGLIYWPAVAVAGVVSLLLLLGLFLWVAAHPAEAQTADAPAPPREAQPAPPPPTPVAETPATEPASPERHSHKHTSVRDATGGRRPTTERPPEESKKTPPQAPPPEPKKETPPPGPRSARPAGEKYGTSVLFLSNPDEAARLARAENKLLFVLHVSGNLEDSCFT
jgi:outer membrane biosynthesis protein TonB